MSLLILSIAIQAGLIIHVIKTGRNQIWIWVLALLSYAGILAYIAVELVPDLFRSRAAQRTARGFKKAMSDGENEEASTPPKQIRSEGTDAEFPEVAKATEAGKTDRPA